MRYYYGSSPTAAAAAVSNLVVSVAQTDPEPPKSRLRVESAASTRCFHQRYPNTAGMPAADSAADRMRAAFAFDATAMRGRVIRPMLPAIVMYPIHLPCALPATTMLKQDVATTSAIGAPMDHTSTAPALRLIILWSPFHGCARTSAPTAVKRDDSTSSTRSEGAHRIFFRGRAISRYTRKPATSQHR